jgi:hypothetical protein
MPIIVAPGDPLAPLTQGDLLKDVPLFVSGALDTDAPFCTRSLTASSCRARASR